MDHEETLYMGLQLPAKFDPEAYRAKVRLMSDQELVKELRRGQKKLSAAILQAEILCRILERQAHGK